MKSLYLSGLVRFYGLVMIGLMGGLLPVQLVSITYESVRLVYVPNTIKRLLCDVRSWAAADEVDESLQELYNMIDKNVSVAREETVKAAVVQLYSLVEKNEDVLAKAELLHELDEYVQKLESGSVVLIVSQYGVNVGNRQIADDASSDLQMRRNFLNKHFIGDALAWSDATLHDIFNFFENLWPKCSTGATGATGEMGPQGPMGPVGATGAKGQKGATGAAGQAVSIGCVEVPIKSLFQDGHNYYARYGEMKQVMGCQGAFTIVRPRQITYLLSPDLFEVSEIVTGRTSGAIGIITADNGMDLSVDLMFGDFIADEIITGGTSRNTAVVAVYNEAFSDVIHTTQQGLRASINWNLHASITSSAQTKVRAAMIAGSRHADVVASFISAHDSNMVLPIELGGIAPYTSIANVLHWDSPASDILTLKPSALLIQYVV